MKSKQYLTIVVILVQLLSMTSCLVGRYPIAVFHGIVDSCKSGQVQNLVSILSRELNVYSVCIEIGNGEQTSIFGSLQYQSEYACKQINKDMNFHGEFALLGISQGALIARSVLQKCETKGKIRKYMSLGGPQMGVFRVPHCTYGTFCVTLAKLISYAIDIPVIQHFIAPAQYWRDPNRPKDFLRVSEFLADLNNEKKYKNQFYKENILKLDKFILVRFMADDQIFPSNSEWFGYIDRQNSNREFNITQTDIYKYDYLGLKTLDLAGNLLLLKLPGKHVEWNDEQIIGLAQYLN